MASREEHIPGSHFARSHLFMSDITTYIERIKAITLKKDGVQLSDADAHDVLLRLSELVQKIYQHNHENHGE